MYRRCMRRVHDGDRLDGGSLRPHQQRETCRRQAPDARQCNRYHHRHGQIAGAIRQCRRRAVSESVREHTAPRRNCCGTRSSFPTPRCAAARPTAWSSTFVYVVNADHTVSVRPVTLGVVDGERVAVTLGTRRRRDRGHRRRRPAARRRAGAAAASAPARAIRRPPPRPRAPASAMAGSKDPRRPRAHTSPPQ